MKFKSFTKFFNWHFLPEEPIKIQSVIEIVVFLMFFILCCFLYCKWYNVIVAVDSDKLYPERPDEEDATNHAIVVTGIDQNLETVTICDPEDLTEKEIETSLFMSAWYESQHYMVCAH